MWEIYSKCNHFSLSLSLSLSLTYYFPSSVPPPNVHIRPRSVDVSVNSTVTLTCVVQSLTIPTVNWSTNTNMTLPSSSLISNDDIHTRNITLKQVTLEYIGEYTCTAENEGGEMSDMIIVDVDGKKVLCFYNMIHMSVSKR